MSGPVVATTTAMSRKGLLEVKVTERAVIVGSEYMFPINSIHAPGLNSSVIANKARASYAPSIIKEPPAVEKPPEKRRPGRPPGYFLGPTSCAYCRQQHRRCDFNTVCHRCAKAKIPCDRSGTVERPSVIVREARIAAKAEVAEAAAAALAAAVAAGLAVPPDPKPIKDVPGHLSFKSSQKRRRSPSPSDINRGNIIEHSVKRIAAPSIFQKYDPSIYIHPRGYTVPRVNGRRIYNVEETIRKRFARMRKDDRQILFKGQPAPRFGLNKSTSSEKGKRFEIKPLANKREAGRSTGIGASLFKRHLQRQAKASKLLQSGSKFLLKRKSKKNISETLVVPQKRSHAFLEETEDSESGSEQRSKPKVRLVKKTYLKSGLYSADLKVNHDTPPPANKVSSVLRHATRSQSATPGSNGGFFQLPINYGSVLMTKQRDFRLPFDIMQAWQVGMLRQTKQPEPFVKIRSNIFVERKRRIETSPMVCHCKPPPPGSGRIGCGEDCYNRVMFYECISAHCPCGDQCSNQRFQRKHDESNLRVIFTPERGFGLKSLAPIKKGNMVIEYRGEVISQVLCHERMETIYKENKNFYFLEYEKGEVVDACLKGTNARFVNHSCSPNSHIEKWFLNGEMSIGIFASQDIPAGSEIFYDYNFNSFSGAQKQICRCGAPNCRGYIGERISKSKELALQQQANGSSSSSSTRVNKKEDGRKRKAGRRKLDDPSMASVRFGQMPSLRNIRQRQSDKYKEEKMAAIRYTHLFMFRNIRLVESKYVKYAQTKSRSQQETVSKPWLTQARQCRKRSLEGVVEDLKAAAAEKEDEERRAMEVHEEENGSSVAGDDHSEQRSMTPVVVVEEEVDADAYYRVQQQDDSDHGLRDLDQESRSSASLSSDKDSDLVHKLEDEPYGSQNRLPLSVQEDEDEKVDELEHDSEMDS
ncbi:Histone-Lysine N-Methyltransferase ash1l [Lunasporangiospora selenospora]|uniref:Histone-Lysine N-Methyltransferase ash1l n=1 Tax=Lunasporangiospora selenospora TaxID=979761 RepID=A0A9P6FZS1_9FUNG|nr:Histone-Lysine N-Methyltransferase ash1l [Lunasporangiospora selenospora]